MKIRHFNVWTMDVSDALEAVRCISSKRVILCYYNVPFLWKKRFAPTDDQRFKCEVDKMRITYNIMHYADEIKI